MIKKIKAAFILFTVLCIVAVMFCACSQTGMEGEPGGNRTGMQNMMTGDYNRNNLVNNTTRYGNDRYGVNMGNGNLTGTRISGNNGQGLNMFTGGNDMSRNNNSNNMGNTGMGNTGMGNTAGLNQNAVPNRDLANRIASQVRNLNGVRDCQVVVMGDTALVGFSPESNRGNINAIKNDIIRRVKQTDRSIRNVTVTESSDFMSKLERLSNDIMNNRPVNTIRNEFNTLMRDLNPAG